MAKSTKRDIDGDANASAKAVVSMVALVVLSFYAVEGHKTWNAFGLAIFIAMIGATFWFAFDNGFHGWRYADFWGQWIVGLFMALAVQGGRLYRSLTGRVPVSPDATDHHAGGHHG